jgi:hypothetical protein
VVFSNSPFEPENVLPFKVNGKVTGAVNVLEMEGFAGFG